MVDYTATSNSLMIVANTPTTVGKAMKYMFITQQALQIAQLIRDYTSKVVNANNPNRTANGNGAGGTPSGLNGPSQPGTGPSSGRPGGIAPGGRTGPGRRKSVEFDLALRNTITTDKINKPSPFASMIPGNASGPIPQPRRSLMSASSTYDTQFYMQHTQAQAIAAQAQAQQVHAQQLYQNHAQLQYQILQQQFAAQQMHNLQLAQQAQAAMAQQQQQQQGQGQPVSGQQLMAVQQAQQQLQQRRPRPLVRHTEAEHV